jgi:uncharacterized membrane protein YkvA (DUF1232 family)
VKILSRILDWITTPYAIYLIVKDPAVATSIKFRAVIGLTLIFAYVISPFDIIPDFIPLAGLIDDLIMVPLGLILLRHITPGLDLAEKREKAQSGAKRVINRALFVFILAILLGLAWFGLLVYILVRFIQG